MGAKIAGRRGLRGGRKRDRKEGAGGLHRGPGSGAGLGMRVDGCLHDVRSAACTGRLSRIRYAVLRMVIPFVPRQVQGKNALPVIVRMVPVRGAWLQAKDTAYLGEWACLVLFCLVGRLMLLSMFSSCFPLRPCPSWRYPCPVQEWGKVPRSGGER